MKKYTLRFRAVNKDIFLDIKSGKKVVETRAATKKYKDIAAGDTIVLVCGKEQFEKKVKKAKIFKNIKALIKAYPIKKIMPHLSSEKELQEAYYSYPDYKEKIRKDGLIALELKN
ncbi:MAG: ASCH domain-containing protein [Patescibacteria group bacterium]